MPCGTTPLFSLLSPISVSLAPSWSRLGCCGILYLSFLFPLGPKQLEATVRWPLEVLWQRPRRVAAARANADVIAARLVQDGLNLISEVKVAFHDAAAAEARVPVAADADRLQQQIAQLTASRLAAGDISEMEARAATTDAARSEQDTRRAEYDAVVARERVRFLTGLGASTVDIKLVPAKVDSTANDCGDISRIRQDAAAARPDVRAAELAVETAAARAGWERSRVLTLSAVLDANGAGREGFEMGPGIDAEIPLFARNQGQIARADAEVERASRAYLATRHRVDLEIRESAIRYEQASRDATLWQNNILAALERDVEVAQKTHAAGEQPYLFVVETARRAADARLRAIDAAAEVRRSRARLERAIGRACGKDAAGARSAPSVFALMMLAASGCDRSTPAANQTPPAKVQAPVKETELTTITLSPEAEKRLGIETAVLAVQTVPRTRSVGGEVIVIPGASVKVAAPVAGTLEAGAAPVPGTLLRRGQRVFRLIALAPAERDASIDAEREVDDARAKVDAGTKKAARAEQLLKDGAGSRRALEEAQTELEVARAALKAAQSRAALVSRGPIASGAMDIASPLTGTLLTLAASPGQTVAASAPLFEVARTDPLWIRVPSYAGDISTVDPRQPAIVSGLGVEAQGAPRSAKRTTAPPSANPDAASVDVFYEIANGDGALKPGQRVNIRLPLAGSTSTLAVPKSALLHDASGGTWVYESRGSHVYARRRVDVSDIVGDLAVIARGPAAGTRIVTVGAAELFGTEFGSK